MGSWLEKPAAPKGNDIRTPQTLEVCGKISHIWLSYAGPGVVEQIFAGVTLAEGDSFEHVQWWPAGSRPRTRRGAGGKFVHVTAPERIYLLTVEGAELASLPAPPAASVHRERQAHYESLLAGREVIFQATHRRATMGGLKVEVMALARRDAYRAAQEAACRTDEEWRADMERERKTRPQPCDCWTGRSSGPQGHPNCNRCGGSGWLSPLFR